MYILFYVIIINDSKWLVTSYAPPPAVFDTSAMTR